jgi:hypothetical protein
MSVGIIDHMFEGIFLDVLVLMHVQGVRVFFFGRFFNLNHIYYEFWSHVSKILFFNFIFFNFGIF